MVAMVSAPTIDDARAAGRALTGAGAREVLAFGSVARGDAAPYSDIDLVVVLNDLDYRQRRSVAVEFKAVATAAAGRRVDVWLTDVPEWAVQNRRAASFAAAIRDDLVAVAAVAGDDSAIRWDKEQVMAASDTDAAFRRLDETRRQLLRIIRRHHPDHSERQAEAAGDLGHRAELRADRLVEVCTAAALAIETAFKALGTDAQIDPRLLLPAPRQRHHRRAGRRGPRRGRCDPHRRGDRRQRDRVAHTGRLHGRPRRTPGRGPRHPRLHRGHRRRGGCISRLRQRQARPPPRPAKPSTTPSTGPSQSCGP